jgi:hypothetical protein
MNDRRKTTRNESFTLEHCSIHEEAAQKQQQWVTVVLPHLHQGLDCSEGCRAEGMLIKSPGPDQEEKLWV